MAEQLIWQVEELAPFLHHPQPEVQHWAVERLRKVFPDQATPFMMTAIDAPDGTVALGAITLLGHSGQPEIYGPPLLERLPAAEGRRLGWVAQALGELGYRAALPALHERLLNMPPGASSPVIFAFRGLVTAMSQMGGDEARAWLWELWEKGAWDELHASILREGLLRAGRPSDVVRLLSDCRAAAAGASVAEYVKNFASETEVERLMDMLTKPLRQSVRQALDTTEAYFDDYIHVSDEFVRQLERSHRHKFEDAAAVLLAEAQRLADERGDDVAGWRAAWEAGEALGRYRRLAVLTFLLLEGMNNSTKMRYAVRHAETALGVALVLALSAAQDDQALLQAATDRADGLVALVAADFERFPAEAAAELIALGPEIAPRLIAAFDPEDYSWGAIHIAKTIQLLARRYPGSCDEAAPRLIEAINDNQGDFLLEECSDALVAIGPAAVDEVARHLDDEDEARVVYLAGVLGNIPIEQSVDALIDALNPDLDIIYPCLSDTGSRRAIEPLYEMHDDNDPEWIYSMLLLCEINGVSKPELPEWREAMAAQEKQLTALTAAWDEEPGEETDAGRSFLPLSTAVAQKKGPSVQPKKGARGKRAQRRQKAQKKRQK